MPDLLLLLILFASVVSFTLNRKAFPCSDIQMRPGRRRACLAGVRLRPTINDFTALKTARNMIKYPLP
jgi:hypothetical protein